jgi:phage gp36-like protein
MPYATENDLNMLFGFANVTALLNTEGFDMNHLTSEQEVLIQTRLNYVLEAATNDIDAALREGPYVIPFDPVPPVVQRLAAQIAFVHYLYSIRYTDDNVAVDQYSGVRKQIEKTLRDINAV